MQNDKNMALFKSVFTTISTIAFHTVIWMLIYRINTSNDMKLINFYSCTILFASLFLILIRFKIR